MSTLHPLTLLARAVDKHGIDPDHLNLTTTDPRLIGMQRKYCTIGVCPIEWATIKYRPSPFGNALYAVLLALLLLAQLWFGIRKKTWSFMAVLALGTLGEIIGYIGRLMLHKNPFLMNNFLTNLVPLTISPALLTAGIYLCLGRVIIVKGAQNSLLKPRMYSIVFMGCDLLALVLQAIGGGMAATAADKKGSDNGVRIMIVGLISQVLSMAVFFAVWAHFVWKTRNERSAGRGMGPAEFKSVTDGRWWVLFQWGLFVASVLIFIRCIYRVLELWGGFSSHLANDEATFMIFEGPLIILAIFALTLFHPGRIFGEFWPLVSKGVGKTGGSKGMLDEEAEGVRLNDGRDFGYSGYARV